MSRTPSHSHPSTQPSPPSAPPVAADTADPAAPAPASGASPLVQRAATAIPVALAVGGLVGALAWVADALGYPLGLLVPANLVGAWALVAFGAGAGGRTVVGGAGRGLFALLAAVAVYYLAYRFLGEGWRVAGAVRAATIWGLVAVLAGPPLGFAGGVWRHRTGWARSVAIALPAGILVAEGLLFQAAAPNDPVARGLFVLEAVAGVALALAGTSGARWRAVALVALLVVAAAGAVALLVVLPLLRSAASTF